MNPCTPHSTVNPDLHARWLSWLDPDAVKSAAGGRLLDERHIDVKTKQARVLVERYFDPVKQRVRVRKRYVGDYSPMQAREFDRISTLMVKNFFPSSVTLGSQSPTLQLGGQRSESDRGSEARETEIDMAHFGSDLLAWEGLARNARLSPFSQVSSLAALYAALLRKMHQFHRCGLIHCDIKADNICVTTTSASAGGLTAALSGSIELASITPIDFGMTLLRGKQDAFDSRLVSNADYMPRYYLQCMDNCWRLMLSGERDASLHLANDLVSCLSWRVDAYSLAYLMSALTNMAIRFHGANAQQAQPLILVAQKLKAFGSTEPGLAAGADQRRWANQLMSEIKPGATDLPYIALAAELEKLADNLGADHNGQITYDLRDVAVRVQTKHRPLDPNTSELPSSESLYVLAGQSSHAPSAEVIDERLWKLAQALAPKGGAKAYSDYLDKAPHPAKYEAQAIKRIEQLSAAKEKLISHVEPTEPERKEELAEILSEALVHGTATRDAAGILKRVLVSKSHINFPIEVFTDFLGGPEMVRLPVGSFFMGSSGHELGRSPDEGPRYEVHIGYALAISKYPVTFALWDAYVADGGTKHKADDEGWGRDLRPLINVYLDEIPKFIGWLNKKLGLTKNDATRYRLPTEAEWEYAARAGSQTKYPFGNDERLLGRYAWFDGNSGGRTQPVGGKQANAWGLHDMLGNVWEWVAGEYGDSYIGARADGSANGRRDEYGKVARGGSCRDDSESLRSATRHRNEGGYSSNLIGLRLARKGH